MSRYLISLLVFAAAACGEFSGSDSSSGLAGSMSRFAVNGDYLYVATNRTLITYSLTAGSFAKIKEQQIEEGLETITTKGSYLYLGSRSAMFIYSIANPAGPEFLFRYEHVRSCDPVVVQGNRAYVTLRSGNPCRGGNNTLEIIDITDPMAPTLIKEYQMTSPGGLGISGSCLFVCEGESGLKMLNVANDEVKEVYSIKDLNTYDVIVQPETVTVTGDDGVFQYTYSCAAASMTLVSKIPVIRAEQ